MKAAVYRRYGPPDVVRVEEVEKPRPKRDEVLIKIRATTVSSGDWRVRSLILPKGFGFIARLVFGVFRPRQPILGTELAGTIEGVGQDVTKFKVGDHVFAFPGAAMGAHAEYRAMREGGNIVSLPAKLAFEEAAALSFGGTTALYYLRDFGRIAKGDKVLVIGASGAVGSAAVQLAKHFGAEVTGVTSTANLDLVRSLGAADVIDYTRSDFLTNGETYDIILDSVGRTSFSTCKNSLKKNGRLLLVAGDLPQLLEMVWAAKPDGKRILAGPAKERLEDLILLKQLAEAGAFKPLIDRRYPLERIVEAHAHVDTGHKKGSVVITI